MTNTLLQALPNAWKMLARVARSAKAGGPATVAPTWGPVARHVAHHELPLGEAHRLVLHRGETVLVRCGRLWLTREGDALDHLLQPGRGFVAARAEEVVVEAIGAQPCRFERHRLGPGGVRHSPVDAAQRRLGRPDRP